MCMKQIKSYSIHLLLIGMIGINLFGFQMEFSKSAIDNQVKYIDSKYLVYEEETEEPLEEEPIEEREEKEEIISPIIKVEPKFEEEENLLEEDPKVIETLVGKLSGYGPDCVGCTSNKTASGYYIGEGNIYYEDPVYGTVRILSGDKKYPFGTIVRISNISFSTTPIIGIVLDRGGSVGIDKKYLFDLLYTKESEAETIGISNNVIFEVLRLGV